MHKFIFNVFSDKSLKGDCWQRYIFAVNRWAMSNSIPYVLTVTYSYFNNTSKGRQTYFLPHGFSYASQLLVVLTERFRCQVEARWESVPWSGQGVPEVVKHMITLENLGPKHEPWGQSFADTLTTIWVSGLLKKMEGDESPSVTH